MATYQDVIDAPEHLVAELIDGELFTSRALAFGDNVARSRLLGTSLGQLTFDHSGAWWILFLVELHLGGDVLVPDLAGWRRERFAEFPWDAQGIEEPPDWILEVVSPATAALDLTRKLPKYARYGVSHTWVMTPSMRTVEVLRLTNGEWAISGIFAGDNILAAEPFEEITIDLSHLWLGPPP